MPISAFGEDLAVAAMAAVNVVLNAQQVRLTDGGRLLPNGQVGRPAVVVLQAVEVAAELDLIEHVLERANDGHVAEDADEVRLREPLELVLDGLVVLVDRDRREGDVSLLTYVLGQNHLMFGHY